MSTRTSSITIYTQILDQRAHALRVFSTSDRALAHLRDHLLTAPESEAWELILEDAARRTHEPGLAYVELIGGVDLHERQAKSDAMFADPRAHGQSLYDAYARIIREVIHEAITLGWYARVADLAFYLGSTGVLVCVRHDTITSAYAPVCIGEDISNHTTSALVREGFAKQDHDTQRRFDPAREGDALYEDVFWFAWRRVRARRKHRYESRDNKSADAKDQMARALMAQCMPDHTSWQTQRPKVLSPL